MEICSVVVGSGEDDDKYKDEYESDGDKAVEILK